MATPQADISTKSAPIKKKRVQLDHVLLDFNFPEKDKLIQLEETLGASACWHFTCLLCAMTHATDGEISPVYAKRICKNHGATDEQAQALLTFCIQRDMIFSVNGMLSNSRVVQDQEACAEKREHNAERQRAHRAVTVMSQLPNNDITKGSQESVGVTPATATATDTETDLNSSLKIPKKLSSLSAEAIAAIETWAKHRKKLKLSFDEMAADALQASYSGRSNDLISDINWSIQNDWKTIRAKPPDEKKLAAPRTAAQRNQDATEAAMAEIFAETRGHQ